VHCVCELIRICIHIKILQKASGELTEKKIMRLVNRPQTPVGVVVRTRAGTERSQVPEWGRLPVVVVVGEAGEAREAAFLPLPLAFLLLPLFLPPTVLLEKLQLAVYFLSSFPVPTEGMCSWSESTFPMKNIIVVTNLTQIGRHTIIDDLFFTEGLEL